MVLKVMCGKFTAMASWAEVVAFSQPLTTDRFLSGDNDRQVTFRVMDVLPLHVWDNATQRRRILGARWGFPHPNDWRRPQPIHARSESIESTKAFARAFLDGQRGIALVKTFNEAPDVPGKSEQHTITPDANMSGIAFVWRQFDVGANVPLFTCVMVTVPANKLIASLPTDRMPAILDRADWAKWIGEEPATMDQLKTMLKTVEDVNWKMAREEKTAKTKRTPAAISDPTGLL
jgi:putative SOS response-associated peptidase YedK